MNRREEDQQWRGFVWRLQQRCEKSGVTGLSTAIDMGERPAPRAVSKRALAGSSDQMDWRMRRRGVLAPPPTLPSASLPFWLSVPTLTALSKLTLERI